MDKSEVTQGQWNSVVGTNPEWTLNAIGSNYPMYYINRHEAVECCNRLSMKEGQKPAYPYSEDHILMDLAANEVGLHDMSIHIREFS